MRIRRGHHPGMPTVENRIINYRIKLQTNIPSYIRLGSESVPVRYSNQPLTCRKCDSHDHIANSCRVQRFFNCDEKDQLLPACQNPLRCGICNSTDRLTDMCAQWQTIDQDDDEDSSSSNEDTLESAVSKMIVDEIRLNNTSPELLFPPIVPNFPLVVILYFQPAEAPKRGPGVWKINISLLQHEKYLEKISGFQAFWQLRKMSFQDLNVWWDKGKRKIKHLLIECAKKQSREKRI